ncbi:hypothetical protein PhCBS80983_g00195 [Powellomyces hirtus]|uniref:Uncharacterized protein n=1 Tax=Powellomyces hirtus TaxID=109895 RepID=A0A507EGI6_9FUNG|nr:hypothetical protein PhCBS80983_g00195 [Powellomyces hirtus]
MLGRQPSAQDPTRGLPHHTSSTPHTAAYRSSSIPSSQIPAADSSSKSSQISHTMYLLVQHFFERPQTKTLEGKANMVDGAFQYCMRILRSHMETAIIPDEAVLAEKIKKHLTRREKSLDKAIRFSNLHQKLTGKSSLTNQWASVYFLLALSQQTDRLQGRESRESVLSLGLQRLPTMKTTSKRSDLRTASPSVVPDTTRNGHIHASTSAATHTKGLVPEPSGIAESEWLRDVVYVFQGIDGKYMKYDAPNEKYAIDPEVQVTKPEREILLKLVEMGWLYRQVMEFVDKHKNDTSEGLIRQSFCSALAREMSDYYRLIAILQGQISPSGENTTASPLTLKRLYVWTQDPLKRLRIMGVLVELCADEKGGALLSLIHNYVHHGDPFISQFITNLMTEVSKPFFQTLMRWVYEGELDDPSGEFYITQDSKTPMKDFWELRFSQREEMLPGFLDISLATQIFSLGKSLNFIRLACKDTKFVLSRSQQGMHTEDLFVYGANKALTTHIQFLYRQTNHQALNILVATYKLKEHFNALNRYLLLEQGDLAQYLVDAMGKELCKDARQIYRHDLAAALENGIRLSNARYDNPDVLRRLDARLLEVSAGDAGWDVFCIDYHVKEPIDTILSQKTMRVYQRLSCFLWKLKRVEYALSSTWKARMRLAQNLRETSVYPDLHACLLTWAQMNHVIVQVQYHINFEALASTWADFHPCLDDVNQDIDGILKMHKTYLNTLLRRCMLTLRKKNRKGAALQNVVDSVLSFQVAHERLHRYGTALARQAMDTLQPDMRERSFDLSVIQAVLPDFNVDEEDDDEETLNSIRAQVDECQKKFKESVEDLKEVLLEADGDAFRGLIVRLNFNQFYFTGKGV